MQRRHRVEDSSDGVEEPGHEATPATGEELHRDLPTPRPEVDVLWRVGEACNFSCDYCPRNAEPAGVERAWVRWDAEALAAGFDRTGRRWRIRLTGGEPLLHPDVLPICQALTRRHELVVNTNLTTENVLELAATVPPTGVHSINASIHVEERERHGRGLERFLELLLAVQARGFRIRVLYVTHPSLWPRLERDIVLLRERGVREVYLKLFRGHHAGRTYPRAYRPDELRWLIDLGLPPDDRALLAHGSSFIGRRCGAGKVGFSMDAHGNLRRCDGVRTPHGNILGEVRFNDGSLPCPTLHCSCPYQGLSWALPERNLVREAWMFARWLPRRLAGEVRRRFDGRA